MQNIYIAAVGKLKEKYLRDAFAEYEKRLSAFCRFRVIEIDEERLPDKPSEAEIKNGIEKGNGIVIGSSVTHHADASGIGQHGKVLVSLRAGVGDLFPYDGIGLTKNP